MKESYINVCDTANIFVGILLVVLTGLCFHIYGCCRIYGERDVTENSL